MFRHGVVLQGPDTGVPQSTMLTLEVLCVGFFEESTASFGNRTLRCTVYTETLFSVTRRRLLYAVAISRCAKSIRYSRGICRAGIVCLLNSALFSITSWDSMICRICNRDEPRQSVPYRVRRDLAPSRSSSHKQHRHEGGKNAYPHATIARRSPCTLSCKGSRRICLFAASSG